MRRPVLALAVLTLAGACKPSRPAASEEPPFPAFAGAWKPAAARKACAASHIRFAGGHVFLRRDGVAIPAMDIRRASANGPDYDLDLAPSRLAAAKMGRNGDRASELLQYEMRLTLVVRGERIAVRDVQIREANKGVRVPTRAERRQIETIFSLEKCPESGRTS